MGRYSCSARTTNAPTSTLPGLSLYAIANVELFVLEVSVYNTTTTACAVSLCSFTTAGTQGTGLTEAKQNPNSVTPSGTGFQSHTGTAPTIGSDRIKAAEIAAAVGAGVVWSFIDEPLNIPQGTANGIGILCPVGTGQIVTVEFVWRE